MMYVATAPTYWTIVCIVMVVFAIGMTIWAWRNDR